MRILLIYTVRFTPGAFFENPAQIGKAAVTKIRQLFHRDVLAAVLADVFHGMGENIVLAGGVVAPGQVGGGVRAGQRLAGLAQVFGQKVQVDKQIFGLDGGGRNVPAV